MKKHFLYKTNISNIVNNMKEICQWCINTRETEVSVNKCVYIPEWVVFFRYCCSKKTSNRHMQSTTFPEVFSCLKFCLISLLQSDLLNMTMYDLVYEDDQSELYNVMVSPANSVDAMHYSDTKGGFCVLAKILFVAVITVGLFSTIRHVTICLVQSILLLIKICSWR